MLIDKKMQYLVRLLILAFAMLATPALLAAAEGNVWSYEDSDGVTHFSNVPDISLYRLYLKTPERYRLKPEFNSSGAVKTSSPSRALTIAHENPPDAAMVAAAATEQQLDPALLHAIIHVESCLLYTSRCV